MQITEHIHALKVPFQLTLGQGKILDRFVYVFLVYTEEVCLVDSGVAGAEQLIFDYMRQTGRSPEEISLLVLTHSHPDHIGAARAIQEATGCIVAAHTAERSWIEDTELQFKERPVPSFQTIVGGPVSVDRTLKDCDFLELHGDIKIEVLHTPGHSKGSISLYLPSDKALISADAIPLPTDLPIYEDALAVVTSLQKLMAIDAVDHLLASWDDPREGVHARQAMDEGLQYLQRIHETVIKVASGKEIEPLELCRRVLKELGLPEMLANPLIAASFMANLKAAAEWSPPGK